MNTELVFSTTLEIAGPIFKGRYWEQLGKDFILKLGQTDKTLMMEMHYQRVSQACLQKDQVFCTPYRYLGVKVFFTSITKVVFNMIFCHRSRIERNNLASNKGSYDISMTHGLSVTP